jgi:nucleotide-binding universal stress UspA family protein
MVDSPVILVGADGSDPGRNAIVWAAHWAKQHSGRLVLLTVADLTPFSDAAAILEDAEHDAHVLADKELEYFTTLGIDVPVETRVRSGVPTEVFEDESAEADLIVVGTHKGGLFKDALFGARGVRIAAASKVPVAVIPVLPDNERHGIVVGVSFDGSAENAIRYAAETAQQTGEPLRLVASWTMPVAPGYDAAWSYDISNSLREETEQALDELRDDILSTYPDLRIFSTVQEGGPVHTLADAGRDAVLTVVGNHSRNTLGRLLLGSVSHGLLNNITSPVIIVRRGK